MVNSAVAGGKSLQNHLVEYVVCKYADTLNPSNFGLHLWGGAGELVYSSSDKVVVYSKFSKAWSVVGGSSVYEYLSNLSLDIDDFICVSAFDRGVMWFAGFRYAGLTIRSGFKPVLNITADVPGGGNSYYQGTNSLNFCIPICKFPSDRYYS